MTNRDRFELQARRYHSCHQTWAAWADASFDDCEHEHCVDARHWLAEWDSEYERVG